MNVTNIKSGINEEQLNNLSEFDNLLIHLHPFLHMNGQTIVVTNPSDLPFSIDFFTFGTLIFSWRLLSKEHDAVMNIDKYTYILDDNIALFDFNNMNNQVSFRYGFLHNETIPAIRFNGLYMHCLLGFFMDEKLFNTYKSKFSFKENNYTYHNIFKLRNLFKDAIDNNHKQSYNSKQWEYFYYYNTLNGDNINIFLDIFNNKGAWNE